MEVGGADIQSLIGHFIPDAVENFRCVCILLSNRCQLYEDQMDANGSATVLERAFIVFNVLSRLVAA